MADEAGTMDVGLETTDTSVVEPEAPLTETQPTETETEQPSVETQTQQGQQQSYKAVIQDEKGTSRLDAKAKATLDKINSEDPQLAKEIRNALFEADKFKRALPEGLGEVRRLRETIEQLGGEHGIQESQQILNGWNQFDQQYMAGDPKALEFMLETPESQQAFMKLAPMAFNKFEEMNPQGYAAYICQRVVGDALSNGIPVSLELVQHFLASGDTAKASEQFGKILQWFQALDATSKKQVEIPRANTPNVNEDPRYKDLETREANLTRDEWRRETAVEQNRVYASELDKHLAGRKVTDIQREDILHRVQTKLGLRIKDQERTLDQYFAVRDKEGFLKFANSFSKKNIPELVREAVDRYVPQKPGPKAPPQGGPVRPPVNGAKPEQGFTRVNGVPNNIDWANPFNSMQNVKMGKAITTDGKKVVWK